MVLSFKEWFLSRKNPLFESIFEILRTQDGPAADAALCRFNLRLTESLVHDVLSYGQSRKDVLSCLKFFDWAGGKGGFYHTRSTFHAIFRILSKVELLSLMMEFVQTYSDKKFIHQVRFYDVLVIGYAVAGRPDTALHVFGKMRFSGVDLDPFAYHVLLNSLVEDRHFEVADMIADQIRSRGLMDEITHSIILKSFCKQNNLDRAEEYLRGLMEDYGNGKVGLNGVLVGNLVDALCKDKQFERAGKLVKEVKNLGTVPLEHAYGVWIRNLVKVGNLDGALELLRSKRELDGYAPDIYRYNSLVCRLLRHNRLVDVWDLLMEMKDQEIFPDEVTLNATVCFFCKAGMVDAAIELYNLSAEFGLSMNSMAYNYLIQTLFGDLSIDEAYCVLKNSIEQGYFPGKRTFSIIANILCREMKLDKMMELVIAALDRNLMPHDSIYDKFISALCRYQRVEDGYLVLQQLSKLNKISGKGTYFSLISGFCKAGRADIAATLLMEMQAKGHQPNRKLYRAVVCHLCKMDDAEKKYFRLLEHQLSRYKPTRDIYNYFIDGAGHAKKPYLAKQVYQMMECSEIEPDLTSDTLLLQSYLKSDKIADALNLFDDLSKKRVIGRKLWHAMIVGLCKANKPDLALEKIREMRAGQLKPSIECYEELVKSLCDNMQYDIAIKIIDDLQQIGRPISSFIGNILLLHSLKSRELHHTWRTLATLENVTPEILKLSKLIHSFIVSMQGEEDVENVEELIRQCFPLDLYTYNMLLRRLSITRVNYACKYLKRLHEKGYEPNRWSYDIVIHGFLKTGQVQEARRLMEEMHKKGFDLNEPSRLPYTW